MIHRFGANPGQLPIDTFDNVLASFRSDSDQLNSKIALDDPDNPDIKLARTLANEQINISGANVVVYIRTENADVDLVWDEDPDPTYWEPIPMKAYFKPAPLELELKKWGAEINNKTDVVFSHFQLFEQFGERMLRQGDVIRLPFNAAMPQLNPNNFEVLNGSPTGNFRYNWMYFTCQVETLLADVTVRPEEDMPEDEPLPTTGMFRESL